MSARRYPIEPLLALLGDRPVAVALGANERLSRYQNIGITERKADEYATRLGFATYEIWPEILEDAITDAEVPCIECSTPFIPRRKGHIYCSRACLERRYKRNRYHADPAYREKVKAASRRRTIESPRAISIKQASYYRAHRAEIRARQNAYAQTRRRGDAAATEAPR